MTTWTFETLLMHLNSRLDAADERNQERFMSLEKATAQALAAQEKATAAALAAAQTAVNKAESSTDERLKSMNELRGAMADQARLLMPRAEGEARVAALAEKLDALSSRMDRNEGRGSGLASGWVYLIGGMGLLATLISIVVAIYTFAK